MQVFMNYWCLNPGGAQPPKNTVGLVSDLSQKVLRTGRLESSLMCNTLADEFFMSFKSKSEVQLCHNEAEMLLLAK